MTRIRLALPSISAAAEANDLGEIFAGFTTPGGGVVRREISTGGAWAGELLEFSARYSRNGQTYELPADQEWSVLVTGYGVDASDIAVTGGSSEWTVTLSPDLAGMDGFAVIEVYAEAVGGFVTLTGPFALALIFDSSVG